MDTNEEITIKAKLKEVIFSKENFYIAALDTEDIITGEYFDTDLRRLEGEEITIKGSWVHHKQYGKQLKFTTIETQENNMYFYLTTIVKNIPKDVALKLTMKYSDDELIDILNNRSHLLLKFKGVGEKRLEDILSSWNKSKHLQTLGIFLAPLGISPLFINKIYTYFQNEDNLISKITDNPYMLTKIKGIGFQKADTIAINLGIKEDSVFRIEAGIMDSLENIANSKGDSSIDKIKLFETLDELLFLNHKNHLYEEAIISLLVKRDLRETKKDNYAMSLYFHSEKGIINFFENRAMDSKNTVLKKNLDKYLKSKIKY